MNDQDSVRLPKKWDDDDEARALMETALELMDEINKGRISGEERGWIDAEVVENLLVGQADNRGSLVSRQSGAADQTVFLQTVEHLGNGCRFNVACRGKLFLETLSVNRQEGQHLRLSGGKSDFRHQRTHSVFLRMKNFQYNKIEWNFHEKSFKIKISK